MLFKKILNGLLSKIDELSDILNGYEDDLLINEIANLKNKMIEKKLYVVTVNIKYKSVAKITNGDL